MAYQMAATAVTLNDLEGYSPVAGFFKCNLSNICAAFYTISTDIVLAQFLCISRASFCSLCYCYLKWQFCCPNVCFQPQISYSELSDLNIIGQGGFGVVYRAKHARFGTVVYKELDARKLTDRYAKVFLCCGKKSEPTKHFAISAADIQKI